MSLVNSSSGGVTGVTGPMLGCMTSGVTSVGDTGVAVTGPGSGVGAISTGT